MNVSYCRWCTVFSLTTPTLAFITRFWFLEWDYVHIYWFPWKYYTVVLRCYNSLFNVWLKHVLLSCKIKLELCMCSDHRWNIEVIQLSDYLQNRIEFTKFNGNFQKISHDTFKTIEKYKYSGMLIHEKLSLSNIQNIPPPIITNKIYTRRKMYR